MSPKIKRQIIHGLSIAPFLLLVGCQYDPHAHLYTTEQPKPADVVGVYQASRQTVTREGLAVFKGRPSAIEIRADGTFRGTNILPKIKIGPVPADLFNDLVTASGKWTIDSSGVVDNGGELKSCWMLDVQSEDRKLEMIGLTGKKPPYGLIYTLGDPDSGTAILYEKVR